MRRLFPVPGQAGLRIGDPPLVGGHEPVEIKPVGIEIPRAIEHRHRVDLKDPHDELRDVLHVDDDLDFIIRPKDLLLPPCELEFDPGPDPLERCRPPDGPHVLLRLARIPVEELGLGEDHGQAALVHEPPKGGVVARMDEQSLQATVDHRPFVSDGGQGRDPLELVVQIARVAPAVLALGPVHDGSWQGQVLTQALGARLPPLEVALQDAVENVSLERVEGRGEGLHEAPRTVEVRPSVLRDLHGFVGPGPEPQHHLIDIPSVGKELREGAAKRLELSQREVAMDLPPSEAGALGGVEVGLDELEQSWNIRPLEPIQKRRPQAFVQVAAHELFEEDRVQRLQVALGKARAQERLGRDLVGVEGHRQRRLCPGNLPPMVESKAELLFDESIRAAWGRRSLEQGLAPFDLAISARLPPALPPVPKQPVHFGERRSLFPGVRRKPPLQVQRPIVAVILGARDELPQGRFTILRQSKRFEESAWKGARRGGAAILWDPRG